MHCDGFPTIGMVRNAQFEIRLTHNFYSNDGQDEFFTAYDPSLNHYLNEVINNRIKHQKLFDRFVVTTATIIFKQAGILLEDKPQVMPPPIHVVRIHPHQRHRR